MMSFSPASLSHASYSPASQTKPVFLPCREISPASVPLLRPNLLCSLPVLLYPRLQLKITSSKCVSDSRSSATTPSTPPKQLPPPLHSPQQYPCMWCIAVHFLSYFLKNHHLKNICIFPHGIFDCWSVGISLTHRAPTVLFILSCTFE